MTFADRLAGNLRAARSAPVAVVLLVAANLVPLVGVLFLGWHVATILILYWLENGIVGALNVVRIVAAQRPDQNGQASTAAKIGLAAFFAVHYGIFWVVHGVFVFVLTSGITGFGNLAPTALVDAEPSLLLAALALLISHLASLIFNYFGKGEFQSVSAASQMFLPYPRMVVLHLTIIFGAVFVIGLGQPVLLLVLLVLFKTIADLGLHVLERGRYQRPLTTV
ncbi:MAG: DUF6498-containing protein [Chloroflexota bacterium]